MGNIFTADAAGLWVLMVLGILVVGVYATADLLEGVVVGMIRGERDWRGRQVRTYPVASPAEFDAAFAKLRAERAAEAARLIRERTLIGQVYVVRPAGEPVSDSRYPGTTYATAQWLDAQNDDFGPAVEGEIV